MIENKIQKELVSCTLCNSREYRLIGSFSLKGQDLGLAECLNCKLAYTNPRLISSELMKYFQSFRAVSNEQVDYWRENHLPIMKQIVRFFKEYKPGKLLDIGCGYGFLLNEARNLGWVPYGLEISKPNTDYARTRFGLNVFNGYLYEAGFNENAFKIVTIIDTLYYSYDPIRELREVRRVLEDNGSLIIRDVNRIEYISKWQMIKRFLGFKDHLSKNAFFDGMNDHIYFFSIRSMRKILNEAGFKDIKFYNGVMAHNLKVSKLINIGRSLLILLFNIIWILSCKKLCLAPSVVVVARKHKDNIP
jgi:SAM-dependent methyltransferase